MSSALEDCAKQHPSKNLCRKKADCFPKPKSGNNPQTPPKEPSKLPSKGSPVESPKQPSPGDPQVPSDPKEPEKVSPPFVPGEGNSYCSYATYRDEEATFSFPMDTKLVIKQSHYNENGDKGKKHVSTTGEIRMRPIPKDSSYPDTGYFTVNMYTSDPNLLVERTFDVRERSLRLQTPRYETLDTPGPHCVSLEVTACKYLGNAFYLDLKLRNIS